MLIIREEQMEQFRQAQIRRLKNELNAHIHESWRETVARNDAEGVKAMIDLALDRARFYGIEEESDLYGYVNLMCALGRNFDGERPWVKEMLSGGDDSMSTRLEKVMTRAAEELQSGNQRRME